MVTTKWLIEGKEYANCNCAYGCPCQFNALPTHGHCQAVAGFEIDRGSFGKTKLDGLRAVAVYKWPGPVHEGKGVMQLIVDERADAAQRDALVKIMTGQETEDMATMWWVFAAMSPTKLPPLFKSIEFAVDVDKRRARIVVPGMIDSVGEPIRNPITGEEHRVRIDLPKGFEYRLAEVGSGTSTVTGAIQLNLKNSYGQFAKLKLSHAGIVD